MPMYLRSLLLPLALPLALTAAEPQTMQPTPANPPQPIGRHNHLVDRVIPTYGMNLHRTSVIDLTAGQLVAEIQRFVGDVDTKVMGAGLHRPVPIYAVPMDDHGRPMKGAAPQLVQRKPLAEEEHLMALVEALTKREVILRPGGISAPIPEQQMIDAAFSDLAKAAESLSLGLGDELYTNLEGQHTAWQQRYHYALAQAREAKIKELTEGPKKVSRSHAEEAVEKMDLISELPAMDDTPAANAPAPATPAAMPEAVAAAQPAKPANELPPVAAPAEVPKPKAVVAPEPAAPAEPEAKPADPLPEVVAPPEEPKAVEPESKPVEAEPAPAVETPPAEPASEAAPAAPPADAGALPDL